MKRPLPWATALAVLPLLIGPAWGKPLPPPPEEPARAQGAAGAEEAVAWGSLQEWLALPDWLELELEIQAEPMANPVGGRASEASWIQESSLSLAIHPWPHSEGEAGLWSLQATVALVSGTPNYASAIGAAVPLQELADPTGFWLTTAAIQREARPGSWGLRAGLLNLDPEFFTAPLAGYYLHGALNTAPGLGTADFPVAPLHAPGAVVSLRPSRELRLDAGGFSLASMAGQVRRYGLVGPEAGPGGWLQLLQLAYTPAALSPSAPAGSSTQALPAGGIQLGGYRASGPNRGLYGSVTLPLSLGALRDGRLWFAATLALDPLFNPIRSNLGTGLVVQGPFPGRPRDVLALGVARTGFSPESSPGGGQEGVVELGYQIQLNPNLNLQPTLQWILNPGARGDLPGILATGLQVTLSF